MTFFSHDILKLHIPTEHGIMTRVTRPSFPACDTGSDLRWGWFGAGNETTPGHGGNEMSSLDNNNYFIPGQICSSVGGVRILTGIAQ